MENLTEKQKGLISICEFMGREFTPYRENKSYCKKFTSYRDCEDWIKEIGAIGYTPHLFLGDQFGNYDSNFHSLIEVVQKINWELPVVITIHGKGQVDVNYEIDFVMYARKTLIENTFDAVCEILKRFKPPNPMKKTAITLSIEEIDERIKGWQKEVSFDDHTEIDLQRMKGCICELKIIKKLLIKLRATTEREQIEEAWYAGRYSKPESTGNDYFNNTYRNGE